MSKGINWGEGGKSSVVGMNGLGYFLCEAALVEALVKGQNNSRILVCGCSFLPWVRCHRQYCNDCDLMGRGR